MIFENLFNKPTGPNNIELLTEIFAKAHNSICEYLTKTLNEVLTNNVPTFKAASRFEVGMYLLFRLDLKICNKQEVGVRRQLLYSCTETLLPSDDSRFVDIVNHRLKIYGDILMNKNSGGDWADTCQRFHVYLVNTIHYCGDRYEEITTETMPFVIVDAFERFYLEQALVACELSLIPMFCCVLKHVFSGNNNFTLLPQKEIVKRIMAGFQEGELIVEEERQQLSNSKTTVSPEEGT
ncbi:MAG: hypothetical protein ABSF37_12435 [Sedimentisphaerales bacterium]|jgi:hypothetical protein